jgi:nucleoside-diphosphate-sugar epimerase
MGSGVHVVVGGSGGTGGALVRELAGQGLPVRSISRKAPEELPAGVEVRLGDAADPAFVREASEGAAVIYNAVNPPYPRWTSDFPGLMASITSAAEASGAKLVFADNLYMYDPVTGPLSEASPTRPTGKKGKLRQEMAERLLAAHRAGRVRVAIGRSSDYYGPGGVGTAVGDRVFESALKGKPVQWLGSLDVPHAASYLPDMARALAILGMRDEADGQVWHLPVGEALTGRQFADVIGGALGRPVKASATGPTMVRVAGIVSPFIRELSETMYQWTQPWVVDDAKFQGTFGPFAPTPHAEAVEATLDWFRGRGANGR